MSESALTILCFAAVIIGIFGTFVPFVPGLFLCWAGVAAWTFLVDSGSSKWFYLAGATLITVLTWLFKYLVPTKRMKEAGVPWRSLFLGGVLAFICFFLIPVVGILIGFVGGVFLGELMRLHNGRQAWPSAWGAVKAVGLSMLIDIFGGILVLLVFATGVFLTTDFFRQLM